MSWFTRKPQPLVVVTDQEIAEAERQATEGYVWLDDWCEEVFDGFDGFPEDENIEFLRGYMLGGSLGSGHSGESNFPIEELAHQVYIHGWCTKGFADKWVEASSAPIVLFGNPSTQRA